MIAKPTFAEVLDQVKGWTLFPTLLNHHGLLPRSTKVVEEHPWGAFLRVRKRCLQWLRDEMKETAEQTCQTMSMVPDQVRSIFAYADSEGEMRDAVLVSRDEPNVGKKTLGVAMPERDALPLRPLEKKIE